MLKHVQASPIRSPKTPPTKPSSVPFNSSVSSLNSSHGRGRGSHPSEDSSTPSSSLSSPSGRGSRRYSHSPTSSPSLNDGGDLHHQDSLSVVSSMSCSSEDLGESHHDDTFSSRGSSASFSGHRNTSHTSSQSITDTSNAKMAVRVWVRCLLQEMEYKTMSIGYSTSSREVVHRLLSKFKMKHRDPNLFYLAMEVAASNKGCIIRTCLSLDDDARPAELVSCHPRGDSRLALKMRHGGVVRVYDGALMHASQYKSLLVSDHTSCEQLLHLILSLNNVVDNINNYSIFEVRNDGTERRLQNEERPLRVIDRWRIPHEAQMVVRRTPQPPQSCHQAHARVTPIPTLRATLPCSKNKQILQHLSSNSINTNNSNNNNKNLHKNNQSKTQQFDNNICETETPILTSSKINDTISLLSNMTLNSSYCTSLCNFSPSTTITISSDGISTVQNNSSMSSSNSDEKITEINEQPPCPPPLRPPRRGIIANHSIISRQLPWTGSGDLLETPVDDETTAGDDDARPNYNDYENYFYI